MGYHFTPLVDGQVTRLGGFFNGTKTVKLFNKASGTLLASATVTASNTWAYTDISPISVSAGTTYTVAVYLAGSEIGRASCRERVEISVVAVSLKKKKGIGDGAVTGVQTCALPISPGPTRISARSLSARGRPTRWRCTWQVPRSEERRVGKEWRSRWSPYH